MMLIQAAAGTFPVGDIGQACAAAAAVANMPSVEFLHSVPLV